MRKNKKFLPNLILILGAALILTAAGLLISERLSAKAALRALTETAALMEQRLPPRSAGVPGEMTDPSMPRLDVHGTDYAALLEVPGASSPLPVCADWSKASLRRRPTRFSGSLYDGTLIVGGTDTQGQFDFITRIGLGDTVLVTDLRGAVFTYTVTSIRHAEHATAQTLGASEGDLVLFARRALSSQYVIVTCTFG